MGPNGLWWVATALWKYDFSGKDLIIGEEMLAEFVNILYFHYSTLHTITSSKV